MARPSNLFARLVLGLALVATLVGTASAADPSSRVVYGGRVEDAQGRPIGGIYPLTFSFFRTEKGGRAVWTETHFVAIDNGVYAVELGRDKAFPKNLDFDKSFLGVAITGGKEIVREKFAQDPALLAATPQVEVRKPEPSLGAPPQPAKGSYADFAGFADEAEKAKSADSLGGVTLAELRTLIKTTAPEHKDAGGGKVKIGDAKRYTDQVGGTGGRPFALECPPGFIVTGIRGQAAGYVDNLSVICSPLEQ